VSIANNITIISTGVNDKCSEVKHIYFGIYNLKAALDVPRRLFSRRLLVASSVGESVRVIFSTDRRRLVCQSSISRLPVTDELVNIW